MKTILVHLVCMFTLVPSSPVTVSDSEWEEFKTRSNKVYESANMENLRKFIYAMNKEEIDAHNELYARGFTTYSKAVNQFTDLNEFVERHTGFKDVPKNYSSEHYIYTPVGNAPDSVDWRKHQGAKAAVTKVKNQGDCRSCWAFSSTGSIEGQMAIKQSELVELSEEQLVDCVNSNGCHGGHMVHAFMYIQTAGGIDSESHYPYTSEKGNSTQCRFNKTEAKVKVKGYQFIAEDETALRDAVANIGPISVAIDAYGMEHYKHGIYDNPSCSKRANHAVLVVGYGTAESGIPYWLVKNSWGPSWGEGGYIKMRRDKNNQCGIASCAIYPVM